MKSINIFAFIFGLVLVLLFNYFQGDKFFQLPPAPSQQETRAWDEVVTYARQHLPQEGTLARNSDGFVYLKVDNAYISELFPMLHLQSKGYREPPYSRTKDSPGAHISVIYVDEHITPAEIGQTFHFDVENIVIVNQGKKSSYAILQVKSAELEKLREKYGLSPKLKGHEFHISIAKKVNRRRYK